MPDEGRFSGIGDKLEGDEGDEGDETDEQPAETESESDPEPEPGSEPRGAEYPAFDFDDAKQRPLYARPEAWDMIDDALELDVERNLRREHDIRNASKRELHDALLRVAADHPEEIAQRLVEERGIKE